MSCTLPFELILLVISHIAEENDEESLKQLSLASSAICGPCQSFLFSNITLKSSRQWAPPGCNWRSPGDRLLALLSSSSVIASYVKRINISENSTLWATWLQSDATLSEALHKLDLKKIEGFTLQLSDAWEDLQTSIQGVIVEICESPALLDLSLRWAPLALVRFCGPSLKSLLAVGLNEEDLDTNVARRPSEITLDYLQLSHWSGLTKVSGLILEPSSNIQMTRLRTLHVKISSSNDHAQALALIHLCRNSLETLVLEPCTDIYDPADAFSIGNCPNLTTLDLKVNTNRTNLSGDTACLAWTVYLICNIPPSNNLQTIFLNLKFEDTSELFSEMNRRTKDTLSSALRMLGRAVGGPTSFPRLKTLEVNIVIPGPTEDIPALRTWALDALAIPPEKIILRLKVSLDS